MQICVCACSVKMAILMSYLICIQSYSHKYFNFQCRSIKMSCPQSVEIAVLLSGSLSAELDLTHVSFIDVPGKKPERLISQIQ